MAFEIDEVISLTGHGHFVVLIHDDCIAVVDPDPDPGQGHVYSCLIPSNSIHFSDDLPSALAVGLYQGQPVGLLELGKDVPASAELRQFSFVSLRAFMLNADSIQFDIASRATQIAYWRKTHKFCSACGAPSNLQHDDRAFVCTACEFRMYPRIAPCVIGVVTHGTSLLLVHGRNHKPNIFSAIAGFIEAGETPEQAFSREVKEEVGVEIEAVDYVQSQTWPFPGQLMLGFVARFKAGTIRVDQKEIVDAAWFDVNALPELPPPFTISTKLIQHAIAHME